MVYFHAGGSFLQLAALDSKSTSPMTCTCTHRSSLSLEIHILTQIRPLERLPK